MVTKITPAPTGLPTLCSAFTAKARPPSLGSHGASLGRRRKLTAALTANPIEARKK
jgi:hypothetical protein